MKALLFVLAAAVAVASACTNILVTHGASSDGSSILSYSYDMTEGYGHLEHWPHTKHEPGTMRDVHDWDTGHYLGKIPEAEETYNVVGNVNEYGLAITETTFGGLAELQEQPGGLVDYGSLIHIALQRSKTARGAIAVMADLVERFGYASTGEIFSIADSKEVWMMELIGKGGFERGAVWVALRIPDGNVAAHANQARIRTFPRDNPEVCMFSSDVVSFAKSHGFYPPTSPDKDFSFSDVYNPLTPKAARGDEMRVWSVFRAVAGPSAVDAYVDYASGRNLSNRMPLYVKPIRPISREDVIGFMKLHYDETVFENRDDVGSGPFASPYRWRPVVFESAGKSYANRRPVSVQQTAFVTVAQVRPSMPAPFSAVNWFAADDAACTVFSPVYGGSTYVPLAFRKGNGDQMTVSLNSAFWVFNLVANLAYTRFNAIYPEIFAKAHALQTTLSMRAEAKDNELVKLWNEGRTAEAIAEASEFSSVNGNWVVNTWFEFWKYLTAKFLDGNVKTAVPGEQNPKVEQPGYGQAWYDRIVKETGDKYLIPDGSAGNNKVGHAHN